MVWLWPDMPSDTPAAAAEMVLLEASASVEPSSSDTETVCHLNATLKLMDL